MNHFPPPIPGTEHAPIAPRPQRRGRTIAALTTGVLIGGLAVGTQFAAASTTEPAGDPAPAGENIDIDSAPTADSAWEIWTTCFDGQLGLDGDAELEDIDEERFEAADAACNDLLPEGLQAEMAEWDAYDTCIGEQFGDLSELSELADLDVTFGDDNYNGGVFVDLPVGDDISMSEYKFGEGDGAITITKTGDDVSVSTDGDVTTIDIAQLEWDAFDETCGELLPSGALLVD